MKQKKNENEKIYKRIKEKQDKDKDSIDEQRISGQN